MYGRPNASSQLQPTFYLGKQKSVNPSSGRSSNDIDQEEEEYILNEARSRSERKVQRRVTPISDDLVDKFVVAFLKRNMTTSLGYPTHGGFGWKRFRSIDFADLLAAAVVIRVSFRLVAVFV